MPPFQSLTLQRLILVGFILATLPLATTILTTVLQAKALARDARQALVTVQEQTASSRQLANLITEMERSARQFAASGDNTFIGLYREHQRDSLAQLEQLSQANTSATTQQSLDRATQALMTANRIVESGIPAAGNPAAAIPELDTAFEALRTQVAGVLERYREMGGELANRLPEQANQLQGLLLGQAALAIPLSLGVAVLFFLLAARPLRQLDKNIRNLGRGSLDQRIEISGARDLVELGQRLDWLRGRLLELEQQKTQFLRNVSHELKTPLTNIREAASLLQENAQASGDGQTRQITSILVDNCIRLQAMIEELLRFGSEGELHAEQPRTALALNTLVTEVIERQSITARARNITLATKLTPLQVRGNARQLRLVIDNLLSNALKYTPPYGTVSIRLHRRGAEAQLDIQDSGPGIDPEHHSQVFDWFFKGPAPADQLIPGTGMGLAIAREYAHRNAGDIHLLASENGARFQLTLPVVEDTTHET